MYRAEHKKEQKMRQIASTMFSLPNIQDDDKQVGHVVDAGKVATPSQSVATLVNLKILSELSLENIFLLLGLTLDDLKELKNLDDLQVFQSFEMLQNLPFYAKGRVNDCEPYMSNHEEQIPYLNPKHSTADEFQLISQKLEKYPNDSDKCEVVETASSRRKMSTSDTHAQAPRSSTSIPDCAQTLTTAASLSKDLQSSISQKRKWKVCTCSNCVYPDGRKKRNEKKEHICHIPGCDKIYRRIGRLEIHLEKHERRKLFCICGKNFYLYDKFLKHMRTHTEEKKFQCSVCLQKCTSKDHLLSHLERDCPFLKNRQHSGIK